MTLHFLTHPNSFCTTALHLLFNYKIVSRPASLVTLWFSQCQISVFMSILDNETIRHKLHISNILTAKRCRSDEKMGHSLTCIVWLMCSRSAKISLRFFVPSTLRRVVCAKRRVERLAFSTFVIEVVASWILKYTTASTATVTLSLVKI